MDGNNAAGDGDAGDDGASECECGAALPLPSALAPEGSESPFALGAPAGPDDVDLSEGFQRIGVATDAAAFRRTRTASGRSLPSRDLRNPRRASAAGDTPSPSADSQFGLANSPRSSGPRRTVGAPAPRVKTEPETAEDTDEAFGGDEAAEAETKKRRKVPNSCTNCKRSHVGYSALARSLFPS